MMVPDQLSKAKQQEEMEIDLLEKKKVECRDLEVSLQRIKKSEIVNIFVY